jgi:hypothetical protein
MSWFEIPRTIKTRAGTAGTETFSSGASILQIIVVGASGATVQVPNGNDNFATIPVPANTTWILQEHHAQRVMGPQQGGTKIVFTSTLSYFIEYIDPAGTG